MVRLRGLLPASTPDSGDLPLTERGERTARRLGERPKGLTFAKVFTSPLQ